MDSGATVTTTVTPGDSATVSWEDPANIGAWTAEANVPLGDVASASVSFKREFDFGCRWWRAGLVWVQRRLAGLIADCCLRPRQ